MDVLPLYQNRAQAPLNENGGLLGFPGQCSVWDGSAGCGRIHRGRPELERLRILLPADPIAANTYLVFQRFQA